MDHNVLTQENLELRLQDYLKAFNNEGVEITPNTLHKEVLSDLPQLPGELSVKNQYQSFVRYSVVAGLMKEGMTKSGAQKAEKKIKWIPNWMDSSVRDLADHIRKGLPIILFLLMSLAYQTQGQLQVELGASKSDLKRDVLNFVVSYVASLDSTFRDTDIFLVNPKSLFQLSPQFKLQTGTEDNMRTLQIEAVGSWIHFKTNEVGGIPGPDLSKLYHIISLSGGLEADATTFNNWGVIVKPSYQMWWNSESQRSPDFLKRIKLVTGFDIGYKFRKDSAGIGGVADESLEQENSMIFRARSSVVINPFKPIQIGFVKANAEGFGNVWYDAANGAPYYSINLNFKLEVQPNVFIIFGWQKGSGAPLFNTAEQNNITLRYTKF